jgi:DNA repair protein SbcC/Rad50
MIIKSLRLENIRSYKQHEIQFVPGTTLFEGAIGCGKSTILMAVEFALFGLGSEKAGALLRTKESKGAVTLCFEADNEEFEIQRTLNRKGKTTIQQGDGYIKSKEGTIQLAPTELKERVLQILNFNEPIDPKAQSNIFRYAVFTPQEQMKAILVMDSDARLQTLRKAFRLEGYKIARDNAENIANIIDKQADRYEAQSYGLDQTNQFLETKKQELSTYENELSSELSKETEAEKKIAGVKQRQIELIDERGKLSAAEGELPEVKKQIQDKTRIKDNHLRLSVNAKKRISDIQLRQNQLKLEKPTEKTLEQLKQELSEFQNQQRAMIASQGKINAKIQDYVHIEKKGNCPTCDREADSTEFAGRISTKQEELNKITKDLEQCDSDLVQTQNLIEKVKEHEQATRRNEEYAAQILEQEQINIENETKTKTLEEELENLGKREEEAKKAIELFANLSQQINEIDSALTQAQNAFRIIGIKVSSTKTKIEEIKKRISELNVEKTEKEQYAQKSSFLHEFEIWLSGYFIPTIENIERHVLIAINEEFNGLFQHWFASLVDDPTKEAKIDEEFTPVVEQDGYDQDVQYLSGGEKTSVALAYRLALNMLVRKVSSSMKSSLLILDEPTDGFSKEQLFKVRDILGELQCSQIIIVSHEKELESFADQVYKIAKTNGVSSICK